MTLIEGRIATTAVQEAADENRRKMLIGAVVGAALVALYFVVNALHPLGPGVVLKGLVVGGLNSLVAMGLVLIYRSARIINFSQQVIGGLAATMAVLLVGSAGFPWIVAVAIGMVVAVFTGWLVEVAVIQRFVTAPRLILTVVTIGVYQILGAAELGLPNLFTLNANAATTLTTPFTFSFYLKPFTFTGDDVVALVVIPVALIALYWFFARTDYGVAIRGAADSPERAVLLGIPVRNLSRITWMVAAGLSGIGAILSAPKGIGGFSVGEVSTPATLLLPLAAAVLAGMDSFPLTVAWSLVLGVVERGGVRHLAAGQLRGRGPVPRHHHRPPLHTFATGPAGRPDLRRVRRGARGGAHPAPPRQAQRGQDRQGDPDGCTPGRRGAGAPDLQPVEPAAVGQRRHLCGDRRLDRGAHRMGRPDQPGTVRLRRRGGGHGRGAPGPVSTRCRAPSRTRQPSPDLWRGTGRPCRPG